MERCLLCPFCTQAVNDDDKNDVHHISCPRCGAYRITDEAYDDMRTDLSDRQLANISGWLRENPDYLIRTDNFENLLTIRTPSFFNRTDRILLDIEKRTEFAGEYINPNISWLSIGWCIHEKELDEMLACLLESGMLKKEMSGSGYAYKIAPRGWNRIQELLKVNADSQQGFVAMWFTDQLQKVYDEAMSPGILDAGYRPHRVDLREHNDKIDDEIIAQIRQSRFVLADFTGHRGGVYFEAGFGKGLGLEVIWTCRRDEIPQLHFDIRQYNCIDWEIDKEVSINKGII